MKERKKTFWPSGRFDRLAGAPATLMRSRAGQPTAIRVEQKLPLVVAACRSFLLPKPLSTSTGQLDELRCRGKRRAGGRATVARALRPESCAGIRSAQSKGPRAQLANSPLYQF